VKVGLHQSKIICDLGFKKWKLHT